MKFSLKIFLLLFSVIAVSACTEKSPESESKTDAALSHSVQVIGHRGAMGHATENTLESVQKAIDLGVDMMEIDVFKIKSGEIVVFHDKTLDRLTNQEGKIEDLTLEQLQSVLVDGKYNIPTLQQVIDRIDHKAKLNVELKGGNTAEGVHAVLQENIATNNWKLEDFLISSFRYDELKNMRALDSDIAIAILPQQTPEKAMDIAKEVNAVAINPFFEHVTPESVQLMKAAGLKINPWTVNEQADIDKVIELGVDGIITNYPERVK